MTYSAASIDVPTAPPALAVALAGWLVPGLGYVLIGQRLRAILAGTSILAIFVLGLLIAGVRCVDVPGFDANGELRRVGRSGGAMAGTPLVRAQTFRAILEKPWYIPQVLAGPVTIGASVWSVSVSDDYPKSTARLWDIGTLYTAVAGMLNLLVIIDSAHRASRIREDHPRLGPM